MTPRRFYLLKRLGARLEQDGLEGVWRAKQEAEPGTPLDDACPARAKLLAAGYSAEEDLFEVESDELLRAGLTAAEAKALLAYLESQ